MGAIYWNNTNNQWTIFTGIIPMDCIRWFDSFEESKPTWLDILSKEKAKMDQGSGAAAVAEAGPAPVAEAGPASVAEAGPAPARFNTGGVDTLGKKFDDLMYGSQVVLREGRAMVVSHKHQALDNGGKGVLLALLTKDEKLQPRLLWWMSETSSGVHHYKTQIPNDMLDAWNLFDPKPSVLQILIATRDGLLSAQAAPTPPIPAADSAAAERARRPRRAAKRDGAGAAPEAVPVTVQAGSGEAGNPIVIDD